MISLTLKWSTSLLIAATSSSLWLAHERTQLESHYDKLRTTVDWVTGATRQQAREAFETGNFREAAALLEPAALSGKYDGDLQFLHARTLECVGRFAEAAKAYGLAAAHPDAPALAESSRAFCLRMAGERSGPNAPTREALYRLHEELMRRRQFAAATHIARQLLPDIEPARLSITARLRALDEKAVVERPPQSGRLNVKISAATKPVIDLLRDVPIESLTVTSAGLQDSAVLAGLQIHSLTVNFNPISDVTALRAMPLHKLDISDTHVADIRALAGSPLRELNLSHTYVTFLLPLAICPLERLSLAGLPIHDVRDIAGLALTRLDLSHTEVCDLSPLASMPLEELRLDGSLVRDLRPLAGSHLKRLSLAHTAVTDLSPLSGLPLQELDLRGCELLADLRPLRGCPQLEKLGLPRHLNQPFQIAGFPHLKSIAYDAVWTDKTIGFPQTAKASGVRQDLAFGAVSDRVVYSK
jgi:hypothetical protein